MSKLIRITTVPQSLGGLLKDQLKFMTEKGFEVIGVSSPGERLRQVGKEQGVRTVGIPMTRTIAPWKDLKALWQLYQLFRKEKPDIVHTHTPKAGTVGMLGARFAGVPVRLHTVAGLPLTVATGKKRKLLEFVEKQTYRCATNVFPNSVEQGRFILNQGFASKAKLKVIGYGSSNGIDTAHFDPGKVRETTKTKLRQELGIATEDVMFLFVGRVVSDKGVNELVEAFGKLSVDHQNSKAHLVIVGNREDHLNPLNPETEKSIAVNECIHAVGYKTNVIDYFATADVLTFPSYREGFPNVVMQAAAMQLNSIVSDINGCNEIITNGKNGWVVPSKDIPHLQEKMQWCLDYKEESKEMGLKSREIMQKNYERSFVQSELLKEYRRVLENIEN